MKHSPLFAAVLHEARASGLSVRELAQASDMHPATMQRWLDGDEPAAIAALQRLAESRGMVLHIARCLTPVDRKGSRKTRGKSAKN